MLDNGMMVRETDSNGVSQATYLAGLRGPEYRRDDVNGGIKWYVGACPEERRDGLGSVLAEMDGYTGTLTASRKLDVYGAPRATQGTPSSKHAFVGNLGHTTEPDTGGLVYMRARWMDPVTGRFLSEDPARDGANWYGYCRGNPAGMVDPDGRSPLDVAGMLDYLRSWGIDLSGGNAAWQAIFRYGGSMATIAGMAALGIVCITGGVKASALALAAGLASPLAGAAWALASVAAIVFGLALVTSAAALAICESIDYMSTEPADYAGGRSRYRP
jgi:RHS repeat-associated protein